MKIEASLKQRLKKGFLKSGEDKDWSRNDDQDEDVEDSDNNNTTAHSELTRPVQGPSTSRLSYQEEMDKIRSELDANTDREKIEEIDGEKIDANTDGEKMEEIEDKIDGEKIEEIEDKIDGEKMEEKVCQS